MPPSARPGNGSGEAGTARLRGGRRQPRRDPGAGYGEYFVHRTGHSIGVEVHGNGANMDNLENHDERRVIPWTCFSIEPGVYLPHFGVRSEIDMFVGDTDARVTGEIQREMQLL
jgi:Xaa-Pro dipeptidase